MRGNATTDCPASVWSRNLAFCRFAGYRVGEGERRQPARDTHHPKGLQMSEDIYPNRNRKPRFRAARKREMREKGITPCQRLWVWSVRPSAPILVPEWAREAAVKGLGSLNEQLWLWPVDGLRLLEHFKRYGVHCHVTRQEFRHCQVCCRPLIGQDAEKRRVLDESGAGGRYLPCGVDCERDRESRLWTKLSTPSSKTRARAA
jgi:hypothetical protein